MLIQIALITSVILQFGAFFNTLTLIRRTKFNISWITISIAFFLMAVRRISELAVFIENSPRSTADHFNNWIAVFISLLMFIASFYIRRIFNLQARIDRMRKENEARVLSAIIETEEKERKRFSRELHDGLGPILSSVKMAFSAIDKSLATPRNKSIIEKTEASIDTAIDTVREISNNLSPHLLEKFGLKKAIHTFYHNIPQPEKPLFHLTTTPEQIQLPYNIEVILYRIFCELINNTLKHANARNIDISLFHPHKELELHYSDDGTGFNPSDQDPVGTGLANIRSRVKSLDGKVDLHTGNNKGFFLKIKIPL
ncbi:sensor histidine kinase [Thermophagus sp. OGC60D27]|uniref:sensor histidine kinase n=1 Tax=Thermophagus sp. OGC60D27 TaxID=3458415 RepID=UPI0040377604